NTGLKRMQLDATHTSYRDLLYARRRFLTRDHLRVALTAVLNHTFHARQPQIWGEGTTACASDSRKFTAWDQNRMTEWHVRYGGRGIMIYWHVERKAAYIYSQLKSCSSSEVAAMIEGVRRHCTEMAVDRQYVDSHEQSEVAFAFCHLLGFQLLPRLKAIHAQRLYRPEPGKPEMYPNLLPEYDWAGVAELRYQPIGWPHPYRYVVKRELAVRKTGELYWKYHATVTNEEARSAREVVGWHLRHPKMENALKEHKSGFGLEKLPTQKFHANWASLLIGQLAFNLVAWFKRLVLPP